MQHTVQPGENLWSIANRYGVTIEAVMRANAITNPNLIYIGQTLFIPVFPPTPGPPTPFPPTPGPPTPFPPTPEPPTPAGLPQRVARLERQVSRLSDQVEDLRRRVRRLESPRDFNIDNNELD